MNSIGIFGGTFDPIHIGHLITAQAVKEIRDLEKIIFVPAFVSPHKTEKRQSSPWHRLEMLKLAILNTSYFDYTDFEIRRQEVSFSIDTVKALKQKYPSIELIIGFDNLAVFDSWKHPEEIVKLVELVVLKRETEVANVKNDFFEHAVFVETPVIEISSTEIRERVQKNLPIDFFVPEKVKEYIYKNNLYKEVEI